jgi:hypothetical protein
VTTLETRDQQTVALTLFPANRCQAEVATLPLVAYLPVLGRLAGFGAVTEDNSAWLILLTPRRIVRQAAKKTELDQGNLVYYELNLRVCEGDPNGDLSDSKIKILANTTLAILDGRQADFVIGNSTPVPGGNNQISFLEFGTRLRMSVMKGDDHFAYLDATLELTDAVPSAEEDVKQSAGQVLKMIGKIKLGEPVRMMMDKGDGKKLWCDMTVRKLEQ